ncbi:MAG TPA: M56 family metallopeptidase [Planctomycetaceae bacterium]|nr:M56 family metallopeptidase [Planctomycetaceae bacterium]
MNASHVFETAVSLSLQATVLVGFAELMSRAARSDTARTRIWAGCHVGLLAILFFAISLPHLRLTRPWRLEGYGVAGANALAIPGLVWGAGIAIGLGALALGWVRTALLLRGCRPFDIAGDEFRLPVVEGRPVRMLSCPGLPGPFCWQIHQPTIVLPHALLSYSADELRLVLRHECEHLQAGHPMQLFLQRLVGIVFWFHPAVWWAARQADLYRELVCDSAAVQSPADLPLYLRTLMRLADYQNRMWTALNPAGLAFGGAKSLLAARADRLTRPVPSVPVSIGSGRWSGRLVATLAFAVALIWVPLDARASTRSLWSPWPAWSARVLQTLGVSVRDYEIDGHRQHLHSHRTPH